MKPTRLLWVALHVLVLALSAARADQSQRQPLHPSHPSERYPLLFKAHAGTSGAKYGKEKSKSSLSECGRYCLKDDKCVGVAFDPLRQRCNKVSDLYPRTEAPDFDVYEVVLAHVAEGSRYEGVETSVRTTATPLACAKQCFLKRGSHRQLCSAFSWEEHEEGNQDEEGGACRFLDYITGLTIEYKTTNTDTDTETDTTMPQKRIFSGLWKASSRSGIVPIQGCHSNYYYYEAKTTGGPREAYLSWECIALCASSWECLYWSFDFYSGTCLFGLDGLVRVEPDDNIISGFACNLDNPECRWSCENLPPNLDWKAYDDGLSYCDDGFWGRDNCVGCSYCMDRYAPLVHKNSRGSPTAVIGDPAVASRATCTKLCWALDGCKAIEHAEDDGQCRMLSNYKTEGGDNVGQDQFSVYKVQKKKKYCHKHECPTGFGQIGYWREGDDDSTCCKPIYCRDHACPAGFEQVDEARGNDDVTCCTPLIASTALRLHANKGDRYGKALKDITLVGCAQACGREEECKGISYSEKVQRCYYVRSLQAKNSSSWYSVYAIVISSVVLEHSQAKGDTFNSQSHGRVVTDISRDSCASLCGQMQKCKGIAYSKELEKCYFVKSMDDDGRNQPKYNVYKLKVKTEFSIGIKREYIGETATCDWPGTAEVDVYKGECAQAARQSNGGSGSTFYMCGRKENGFWNNKICLHIGTVYLRSGCPWEKKNPSRLGASIWEPDGRARVCRVLDVGIEFRPKESSCSSGYSRLSGKECKAYAQYSNRKFANMKKSKYPKGCFMKKNKYYLNTHKKGKAHELASLICKTE